MKLRQARKIMKNIRSNPRMESLYGIGRAMKANAICVHHYARVDRRIKYINIIANQDPLLIPSGVQMPIDARIVDITDHTPYIDWEQRRYELVKVITHGLSCAPVVKGVDPNPTPDDFAYMVVRNADAIIKKLKGE